MLNKVPHHEDVACAQLSMMTWRHGGVEVQLHTFLTSALDGGECSCPSHFNPGKEPTIPIG